MASDRGRGFWENLVREVEAGASQVAAARRYGVSSSRLGLWCRLAREGAASSSLLPVRVVNDRARRYELVVRAARLSFEQGTDPAYRRYHEAQEDEHGNEEKQTARESKTNQLAKRCLS